VLAAERRLAPSRTRLSVDTRYLTEALIPGLFVFPKDLDPPDDLRPSTLDRPRVLDAYLEGWQYWN